MSVSSTPHSKAKTSLYSMPETHAFSSKVGTRRGTEKGQRNTLWLLLCPEPAGSANTHAPFLCSVGWPLGGEGRSGVQLGLHFPAALAPRHGHVTILHQWNVSISHCKAGGPFQAWLLWKPRCPPRPFLLLLPALSRGSWAQRHGGTSGLCALNW